MAISESYSASEQDPARALLDEIGIAYQIVHTREVHDPRSAANPADRCYFCKEHLFAELFTIAEENDYPFILDGFNADDVGVAWTPVDTPLITLCQMSPSARLNVVAVFTEDRAQWHGLGRFWHRVMLPYLVGGIGPGLVDPLEGRELGRIPGYITPSGFLELVEGYSDEQLRKLRLGGHDPQKVYNAYKAASEYDRGPTVILARTIKGYGLGEGGEGGVKRVTAELVHPGAGLRGLRMTGGDCAFHDGCVLRMPSLCRA